MKSDNLKILHLTLTKKWFDMIQSGIKKEEYREIKPYWISRLEGKDFDVIIFSNGYGKNAPKMMVEFKGLSIGKGRQIWGGSKDKVYVIKLGDILRKNFEIPDWSCAPEWSDCYDLLDPLWMKYHKGMFLCYNPPEYRQDEDSDDYFEVDGLWDTERKKFIVDRNMQSIV